ncbi:hypothetical protein BJ742DRAFT_875269 [Cladochytrium replicatum]|nr:hypothetical protein BJ742DRAFT_875269 [Cladochytrium replicatum]
MYLFAGIWLLALLQYTKAADTNITNLCTGYETSASDGDSVAILGSFTRKITMNMSVLGPDHSNSTTASQLPLEIVFELHGPKEKIKLALQNNVSSDEIVRSWDKALGAKIVLSGTKRAGCTLELSTRFRADTTTLEQSEASQVLAAFPTIPKSERPTNMSRISNEPLPKVPASVIRLSKAGVQSAPLRISSILSASANQAQVVAAASLARPIGDFYTAVVLIRAKDDSGSFIPTRDEARRMVFSDDSDSIKTFWGKCSYGKIIPRGVKSYTDGLNDIYTIQVTKYTLNNICDFATDAGIEATQILSNQGIDLFGWYGSINFVFSRYTGNNCGSGAFAYVPGQDAYYTMLTAQYPLGFAMKHETGHTFYLPHSSSLDCKDASGSRTQAFVAGGSCTYNEYNDQYSIMGQAAYCDVEHHGRDRFACGWLNAGTDVVDVPSTSGQYVYTVNSLDKLTTTSGSVRILRLPLRKTININGKALAGTWHYYVELRSGYTNICTANYRSPIISIRLAPAPGILANSMSVDYRVDTANVNDAPINVAGGRFTDSYQGLSVLVNTLGENVSQIVIGVDQTAQPPATGGCSTVALVDRFNDQNDFQSNNLQAGDFYSTDGTGDWIFAADKQAGMWRPRSSGGGYWYNLLWDSDYCRDLSSATGLRMRVATNSSEADVTFNVGLDINNGNCSSPSSTFKPLGSVTVVGYEGWVTIILQFSGQLSTDDVRRVQALVFQSTSKSNGKPIFVDDIEFVGCGQCDVIKTVDRFNDANDLNGNDITATPWRTDNTGNLTWDASQSAHWIPSSSAAYVYTNLWSSGYCSDILTSNSLTMNWFTFAPGVVTVRIGVDVLDDCNTFSPKFTLLGTVTIYPSKWNVISLPLSSALGSYRSKVTGVVFSATENSANQHLYFDEIFFKSCPGL